MQFWTLQPPAVAAAATAVSTARDHSELTAYSPPEGEEGEEEEDGEEGEEKDEEVRITHMVSD